MSRRFQFHKGTIRTKRKIRKIITTLYFNSIKVRLELTIDGGIRHIESHFNSIKVRLELV